MHAHVGVSFDGFSTFDAAIALAKEAVAAGATGLWMADHLGYREAILSCLGFALAVPDVRVIPTAVSPYLRHPMPTAMQMATLAEAAPGRAAIAVGVGNPLFLGKVRGGPRQACPRGSRICRGATHIMVWRAGHPGGVSIPTQGRAHDVSDLCANSDLSRADARTNAAPVGTNCRRCCSVSRNFQQIRATFAVVRERGCAGCRPRPYDAARRRLYFRSCVR